MDVSTFNLVDQSVVSSWGNAVAHGSPTYHVSGGGVSHINPYVALNRYDT
jgi:hypothetical protein